MISQKIFYIAEYIGKPDFMQLPFPDPTILSSLTTMKMPFGKYKGILICNLPVKYLEWFSRKGFPPGKMGMLLSTAYEIKLNGLDYLLEPLKKAP